MRGSGSGGGGNPTPTPTPTPSAANQWTWMGGSDGDGANNNSDPVYGTLGETATANVPGGRNSAAYWTDRNGNFWLFGGEGLDDNENLSFLNDLWEYNPSSGEWTWQSGSETGGTNYSMPYAVYGQSGVYGTLGTPASSNVPGGREHSVTWIDSSGNLWLFGGYGFDSTEAVGGLNDLWKFNPSIKEWTWISGSSTLFIPSGNYLIGGQTGVYGTQGIAAASNVPNGLWQATGWIDSNDNLWLFGGTGMSLNGTTGYVFNNLWEFNQATREWVWVSGDGGEQVAQLGVYGTMGTSANTNIPGGREGSTSWIDSDGNLWLFGGSGYGPLGPAGEEGANDLNDLWEFNPSNKMWTWVAGEAGGPYNSGMLMLPSPAQYGTQGVAAAGNTPGGREGAAGWIDSSGNLWVFGGEGVDSTGATGDLNDLWKFNASTKQWDWIDGAEAINYGTTGGFNGSYGIKGEPAATNQPGSRCFSSTFADPSGNLWLFAGYGFVAPLTGGSTVLNDLWRYQP